MDPSAARNSNNKLKVKLRAQKLNIIAKKEKNN